MSALKSVRKYLAILSAFFVVASGLHLVVAYLYSDSKSVPEKGGAISVGFVGSAPAISPAFFRKEPAEDFILRFLYRSLLRYDLDTRTMQGDLANCDLGKNFAEIRCFFKSGALWSDGTPITKDDVLATYALFSETATNKVLQSALAKTTVSDEGNAIVFRTSSANVDLLDVFTMPVVSARMAEKIRSGNFSMASDAVYSGPFVLENATPETGNTSEKITVVSNPHSPSGHLVSKFAFRFFPDADSLVAAKDSLNLIYPNRNLPSVNSPRFATLNLLLPEFVGIFANAGKMPDELRRYVLSVIGNAKVMQNVPNTGKPVSNPFFTEDSIIPEPDNKNYEELLSKLGYQKKSALIAAAEAAAKESLAGKTAQTAENRFFASPTNKKTYVGGESDDILISGSVPEGVTAVYVDDYELKGFVPGSGKFYYRAKISIGTMKEGRNVYVLSFKGADGKKAVQESLVIEYVKDAEAREARRKEIAEGERLARESTANSGATLEVALKKAREPFEGLSSDKYYAKDGKPLTVKLASVELSPAIPPMAEAIEKALSSVGITVESEIVTPEAFQANVIRDGKKEYDLLLTGVNLGLMGYNVFPFFHSGQAQTGFNFTKVKNPGLDALLEELKSKDLNEEGLKSVRERILAILKREAIVLTLSRPVVPYSIDRAVKNAKIVDTIPASPYLFDMLESTYVKESRLANFKTKSFSSGFEWLSSTLFGTEK